MRNIVLLLLLMTSGGMAGCVRKLEVSDVRQVHNLIREGAIDKSMSDIIKCMDRERTYCGMNEGSFSHSENGKFASYVMNNIDRRMYCGYANTPLFRDYEKESALYVLYDMDLLEISPNMVVDMYEVSPNQTNYRAYLADSAGDGRIDVFLSAIKRCGMCF